MSKFSEATVDIDVQSVEVVLDVLASLGGLYSYQASLANLGVPIYLNLDGRIQLVVLVVNPDIFTFEVLQSIGSTASTPPGGLFLNAFSNYDETPLWGRLGGTYSLRISRLDSSGNFVEGATSVSQVYAYRDISTSYQAVGFRSFNITPFLFDEVPNTGPSYSPHLQSGPIDLKDFGGVDLTTPGTNTYRFTITASSSGFLDTIISFQEDILTS